MLERLLDVTGYGIFSILTIPVYQKYLSLMVWSTPSNHSDMVYQQIVGSYSHKQFSIGVVKESFSQGDVE